MKHEVKKINWQKFFYLPSPDRRMLICAILLLPLINFSLMVSGFSRTFKLAGQFFTSRPSHLQPGLDARVERASHLARIISIAARHGLVKATCLRQALLLWGWLRREGIDSQIRFGARKDDEQLEAHAWVEVDGTAISTGGHLHREYQTLEEEFPGSGRGA